ncbi:MAG: hypothetical protein WCY09_07470 [Candidatus Omnitrophota bacterium]
MGFKLKLEFVVLIFLVYFFAPTLSAAELSIPVPENALKVLERNVDMGSTMVFSNIYETTLNQKKAYASYKKQLLGEGWKEEQGNAFIKDRYVLIVTFFPSLKKGTKTKFSVALAQSPIEKKPDTTRKIKPDKLIFMPLYPGSVQLMFWDMSSGLMTKYETEDDIRNVVFFYKSGMLNYGWSLYKETPVKTQTIDSSCPSCAKLSPEVAKAIKGSSSTQATIVFKKGDEKYCTIMLSSATVNIDNLAQGNQKANSDVLSLPPILSSKTTISVHYYENKKVKL